LKTVSQGIFGPQALETSGSVGSPLAVKHAIFPSLVPAHMDDTMMKGPSQAIEPRTSIELANAKVMSEKQGTSGDLNDMDRMGKIQVLKVSSNRIFNFSIHVLTNPSATIQVYVHIWLCCCSWRHLGIRIAVRPTMIYLRVRNNN
jgi:hypothetical protein